MADFALQESPRMISRKIWVLEKWWIFQFCKAKIGTLKSVPISLTYFIFFQTVRNDPSGQAMLIAHNRVDGHPHINPLQEVIVGDKLSYLFFPPCSTDLHSYVRTRRRLREPHARILFRQIVSAVHEAHSKGLVLRDLKLRKFVFTDDTR